MQSLYFKFLPCACQCLLLLNANTISSVYMERSIFREKSALHKLFLRMMEPRSRHALGKPNLRIFFFKFSVE